MEVEARRDGRLNRIQKAAEFACAMPGFATRDHFARGDMERRNERRRPMAHVVVRVPLGLAWPERQERRRPIECLHLRLFIDAEDQRALRRLQVQAARPPPRTRE